MLFSFIYYMNYGTTHPTRVLRYACLGRTSPSFYNHLNSSDPKSPKFKIAADAPYINPCDPDHSVPATTTKIFGAGPAARHDLSGGEKMDGFAEFEYGTHKGSLNQTPPFCGVLSGFQTETKLPVLTALASNFALFDHWYASVPGPTFPNRLFALSATSAGSLKDTLFNGTYWLLYPQKTLYDSLDEAHVEWKHYYHDVPWEIILKSMWKKTSLPRMKPMAQFYDDAKNGDLPAFSWIDPRLALEPNNNEGSNDQHPDHDVALGEALMKRVYEALRAGPGWESTLLIVTYDEHGGFFDSVAPPTEGVPNPGDGYTPNPPHEDFDFTRLGLRIPTLLVSPWVEKGTVIHAPTDPNGLGTAPTPTSQYELSSLPATVKKLFRLPAPYLTKRDAWAATFEKYFETRTTPRTDCPATLPAPPNGARADGTLSAEDAAREAALPLNGLQEHTVAMFLGLEARGEGWHDAEASARSLREAQARGDAPVRQGDVAEWLRPRVDAFRRGELMELVEDAGLA